jgi:hypothetical protein
MLKLFCWVRGNAHGQPFPLDIVDTRTVGDLKEAIKEKKKVAFKHVDADTLTLWKVSTPISASRRHCELMLAMRLWQVSLKYNLNEGSGGPLERLELTDGIEGVRELSPLERLSDAFPDALKDNHVHIVVECPITGEFS